MRKWQIKRRNADLERELRSDLELEEEEQRDRGVPSDEAHYAARRSFDNEALIQDQTHDAWGFAPVERLNQDIRYAFRRIARTPAFAVTVLLTLAIGIGANTAVFSVINRVLLRPLPYPDSDRLVSLSLNAPGAGGLASFSTGLRLSPSMYFTFARHNQTFQSVGIWINGTA
ncbi:MAG TPA: permease prefix domain 1-containing protein, partial [Acidobacteriaceae bacterium]|nr:permease prefix domain 1-containing protein [Acidobacteriaceae bacterium]